MIAFSEFCCRTAANPNCFSKPGAETGASCAIAEPRAETPLHRAAASVPRKRFRSFWTAGAKIDAKDMGGDTTAQLGQLVPTP